jgi:dipeptidyl-peptidase-4
MGLRVRLVLVSATFFCGALAMPAQGARKTITIDDLLAQHPSGGIVPTWAPDGKHFYYQEDEAIFLSGTDGHAKQWFRPDALEKAAVQPVLPKEFGWRNRRVASESFQWFPNSRDLLAEEKGDLFIVHPDGSHEQLTKTDIDEEDPKISPDGKQIVYRWKANLYVLDIESKRITQLTNDGTPTLLNGQLDWVYPEELDLSTAVWWSPDSSRIAYLQFDVGHEFVYPQVDLVLQRALEEPERYPQAGTPNALVKLGIIPSQGGETKWMDLGDNSDSLYARVYWLPDSSAVAVERMNRVQNVLDVLFCSATTGQSHVVIHEQSKTWINLTETWAQVTDNLFFLKTRPEFLWMSERSGFRHVYRYSNAGQLLAQLTSGEWLVTDVNAIDEAKQRVYYTSTEASPLQRQLYATGFDGTKKMRITKAEGVHAAAANHDGTYLVDSYSSEKEPPRTNLIDGRGREVAVLKSPDRSVADKYDLLPREVVQVKTTDGTTLYARLIKPAGFQPNVKYPAIVSVYGGPGVQMVLDTWNGLSVQQVMAHHGYVVWELDNRGSAGRGHAFEVPIYHELGKVEVADQRFGVQKLIEMGFVDPKRVGITGWSYGGYMTIHSLLLAPDTFAAGVAGAPVTDWHNYDTIYTERYMGVPDQNGPGYDASSNVKNAAKLQGSLLIQHNIEDDNVLFQNTMQMADALEREAKHFFMTIYPQKTHGVSGPFRRELMEEELRFFDEHLKPGEAGPAAAGELR